MTVYQILFTICDNKLIRRVIWPTLIEFSYILNVNIVRKNILIVAVTLEHIVMRHADLKQGMRGGETINRYSTKVDGLRPILIVRYAHISLPSVAHNFSMT